MSEITTLEQALKYIDDLTYDLQRSDKNHLETLDNLRVTTAMFEAQRDLWDEECVKSAHLLLQAQTWAMEAKTQRSIVREIYQITTFASGEPGDWNGAKPVKELMTKFVTACHEIERLRDNLSERGSNDR